MNIATRFLHSSCRALAVLSATIVLGVPSAYAIAPTNTTVGTAETQVAINWRSLERNEKHAEVWVTYTFPRTIALGHGLYPHRSQRLQYAIACEPREVAVSQWLLTDGDAGSGQVVWSGKEDSLYFAAPWAGSTEADILAQACDNKAGRDTAAMIR